MKRVPEPLLRVIASRLSDDDRAEMALPSYLHANPALRFMAWRRVEVIAERATSFLRGRPAPRTALDYGCGSGILFPELLGCVEQLYGVDLVLAGAEIVTTELELDRVTLLEPGELDTVRAGTVDAIVAMEVLEHVDDVAEVLHSFRRLLAPSGKLLVSLPTENALYRLGRRLAGFSGHYHHANARTVDAAIRAFGFRRTFRKQIPAPGPFCIYWALEYVPGP